MPGQSIVVRVPSPVAGTIRRLVAQSPGATIGSILSQSIALRSALGTAAGDLDLQQARRMDNGRTSLIKGYATDTDARILRELAAVSGSSIGQIVAQGVSLLCAASGGGPRRGLGRLRPGKRAAESDDLPIVILDDDVAA